MSTKTHNANGKTNIASHREFSLMHGAYRHTQGSKGTMVYKKSAPALFAISAPLRVEMLLPSMIHRTGFTLIETLVAVALLVMAIAGPMSLAAQSLSSAYYARDQITAFHLAQEAIEAVRFVRDGNILKNVAGTPTDLLAGIPDTTGKPFTVDIRFDDPAQSMQLCSGTCQPLQYNSSLTLYGYGGAGWNTTRFTRIVRATAITPDEIRVSVDVNWQTGAFQQRTFTMSENLYRWVPDPTSS